MVTADKKIWQTVAQPWELAWWRREKIDRREGLAQWAKAVWLNLGLHMKAFDGKRVIDVGCGPTGRLECFNGGELVAIDPLWDEYKKLHDAALGKYIRGHSVPAETLVPELVGWADWVVSLNALDHGFDLTAMLGNMHSYLKPGGFMYVSVDVDAEHHDDTHPLILTSDVMRETLKEVGFEVLTEKHGYCYLDQNRNWEHKWGNGTAGHWLCHKRAVQ